MAPPSTVVCLALLGLAAASGPYGSSHSSTGYGVPTHDGYYRTSQYHGGYGNPRSSILGYGTPKPITGYGAPKSSSVIYTPPSDAGYGVSQLAAGYGALRPGSGYDAPKAAAGYGAPKVSIGYEAPQPTTGYDAPYAIGDFPDFSGPTVGGFTPSLGPLGSKSAPALGGSTPLKRDQLGGGGGGSRDGLYLSWENSRHRDGQYTWKQAANECKRLGLRLVSLTNAQKEREINRRILGAARKVEFYWTSGQRLNTGGKFVWNDSKRTPVCNRGQGCYENWGPTGGAGRPQPDNREGNENCLAVLNDFYLGEGIVWHDIACRHQKHFVCEK